MSSPDGNDVAAQATWSTSEYDPFGGQLTQDGEHSDISRPSPFDSALDIDSFFANMDEHIADDDGETTDAVVEDIWDTADTPQQDAMTPNTSSVDGSPANPDDKDVCVDDDDERDEPQPLKHRLRPQSRELKSAFTRTWIDQDETGNYGEKDPSEEVRKARNRRQRTRFLLRNDYDTKANGANDSGVANESFVRVVPKLTVTLSFQSEASKTRYRGVVNNPPTDLKTDYDLNYNGYRLRKRGASRSTKFYSECNLDKSCFDSDLPDDLTGHPVARGCWECLALGIHCPLLDDERAWPCAACIDDDHECDLVTPPVFKRACERCRSKTFSCSYNYTEQHGEACQQCMDDGFRCVAGPLKDHIRVRVRYDRDWVNDPAPKQKSFKARKHMSSNETTGQSKLDVFLTQSTEDKAAQKDLSPPHGQKRPLIDAPAAAQRPTKIQRNNPKSRGRATTIQTKLCHPIVFNHEEDPNGGELCHFCSSPKYPISGLEAKTVEVVQWEDGRGLEEISGGLKGEGVENTRVCVSCTTDRIQIIMCKIHELRPLGRSENDTLDVNDAYAELCSDSGKLKGKWCSICVNLAHYECCAPGEDEDGCGLLACEHCMVQLTGLYDGDLQKMLPELNDEESEDRIVGLRADYDMLKEDGLLMRYVLWSSQQ